MRRFAILITVLMLLLGICSCAPDNVVTPTPANGQEQQDEPKTDDTFEQEQQTQETEQLTEGASYLKNKKKNDGVVPTFEVDTLVSFKTPQLKDAEIALFLGETSAFSAGKLSESEWYSKIAEQYGIKLDVSRVADGLLYHSQLLAQKCGKALDLIETNIENSAQVMSLMRPYSLQSTANSVYSQKVLNATDNKLLAPVGNGRTVWYNKSQGEVSSLTVDSIKDMTLECGQWLDFGCIGEISASGKTADGYYIAITDAGVIDCFKKASEFKTDGKFKDGNAKLYYGNNVEKGNFEVGYTTVTDMGMSAFGSGIGISKTASDEKTEMLTTFATVWCARYNEARTDELMYSLNLSATDTDKYLTDCENMLKINCYDGEIAKIFEGDKVPSALCTDPDTVYVTYGTAYERVRNLNKKYL